MVDKRIPKCSLKDCSDPSSYFVEGYDKVGLCNKHYLNKSIVKGFVEQVKTKTKKEQAKISKEQVEIVKKSTSTASPKWTKSKIIVKSEMLINKQQFLAGRKASGTIGASAASQLLEGEKSFTSVNKVYEDMLAAKRGTEVFEFDPALETIRKKALMNTGQTGERLAIENALIHLGGNWEELPPEEQGTFLHKDHDWISATPDSIVRHKKTGELRIVEAKVVGDHSIYNKRFVHKSEAGDETQRNIENTHYNQVQLQMYITGGESIRDVVKNKKLGIKKGILTVVSRNYFTQVAIFEIDRDIKKLKELLAISKCLMTCVKKEIPPESHKELSDIIKKQSPLQEKVKMDETQNTLLATPKMVAIQSEIAKRNKKLSKDKKELDKLKNEIKILIGDAEEVVDGSGTVIVQNKKQLLFDINKAKKILEGRKKRQDIPKAKIEDYLNKDGSLKNPQNLFVELGDDFSDCIVKNPEKKRFTVKNIEGTTPAVD